MSTDLLPVVRAFDDAELRGDPGRLDAPADHFMSVGDRLDKRRWIGTHAGLTS